MTNRTEIYPMQTNQQEAVPIGPFNIQIGQVPIPIELVEKAPNYDDEADKATQAWRIKGLEYQLGYISLGDTADPEQIERHNRAYKFSVIQLADDLQRGYEDDCREKEGTKLIQVDPTKKASIRIVDLEPWRNAVHTITRRETARDMMSKWRFNHRIKRAIPPMILKHVDEKYQPIAQAYIKELETCAALSSSQNEDQSNQLTLLEAMY